MLEQHLGKRNGEQMAKTMTSNEPPVHHTDSFLGRDAETAQQSQG